MGNVNRDLVGKLGLLEQSATLPDGLELGQKLEYVDGRMFRLAKNGTPALDPGKLVIQEDPEANHTALVTTDVAIGATQVEVTLGGTLVTANQYQDGFLVVRTAGIAYKIKSHPAQTNTTGKVVITLYEPLKVALASAECDLVLHELSGVILSKADQLDIPAGVPLITVTIGYYFWIQRRSAAAIWMDEIIARGAGVTIGSSVPGAVELLDAAGEPLIGHMIEAGVDTKYNLVDMCLS